MNMFKITSEIRSILINDENISQAIGKKIFPILAPEGTDGDFIVYQRDGFKEDRTKFGVANQSPLIFVSAVSADYGNSINLASIIYEALSGRYKDPDMEIQLEDSTEDYIEGKYIQVLQFIIKQN